MTLPLTCPVCANAGAATHARPRATAQIASVRRMVAPVMESSSESVRGQFTPSGGATFVMRYSRTGPRLAARELIARRAATVVARRPAGRAAPVPRVELPDLGRRGIAEQDRRARAAPARSPPAAALPAGSSPKPPAVYDVNRAVPLSGA